jgi:fructose-1,6-bisphosphatase I
MFEANALAFVIEQAGGKARNGEMDILDIQPTTIHQTTPLYIGSSDMVDKIEMPSL